MVEDCTFLGPLELTNGRWGIGDATRPDAHWVEFRPDGLYQHEADSEGQLIPWSRIMNGIWITWGKHSWNTNSRGVYTLRGMVATRNGGWMHTTLRHPYEDHQLRFDQHTRPYRAVDALRLESLLRQLTTEGKLHLLSDPEWVGRAAAYLAGGENRWITSRALRQVAAEALAAAGPGSRHRHRRRGRTTDIKIATADWARPSPRHCRRAPCLRHVQGHQVRFW